MDKQIEFIKEIGGLSSLIACREDDTKRIAELQQDGYRRAVMAALPPAKEGYKLKARFRLDGDCMYQEWEYVADRATTEQQISKLKKQLSDSDYRVIKCFEAQMTGGEMPYDITALHGERQALRDEINELENEK